VRARVGIANNIRSREKLARVVVIIKQRQMKRVATAQGDDCIQLPTFAEARMAFSEAWNIVTGRYYKAMPAIKVELPRSRSAR